MKLRQTSAFGKFCLSLNRYNYAEECIDLGSIGVGDLGISNVDWIPSILNPAIRAACLVHGPSRI